MSSAWQTSCIVLPCFIDGKERYKRHVKWLRYMDKYIKKELKYSSIVLLDNASDLKYLKKLDATIYDTAFNIIHVGRDDLYVIRFDEHLSRTGHLSYPYYYRALHYILKLDERLFFQKDKYIWIDSDVYLLNKEIVEYVKGCNSGWVSFKDHKHKFPESTFFIINQDGRGNLEEEAAKGFMSRDGEVAENILPFTKVEEKFYGGRFPEEEKFVYEKGKYAFLGQLPNKIRVKYNET